MSKRAFRGRHIIDIWTDAVLSEGRVAELAARLDTTPLLVLAGTVLPMKEDCGLMLHVYPPTKSGDSW